MNDIRSKRAFFSLWEDGVLGNRTRLWRDPLAAWYYGRDINLASESMPADLPKFGFRELRKPGTTGAGKWELVPWHAILSTAERWRAEGKDFIIDDGCPNELTTLCGEVCRTYRGLEGSLAIEPYCGMRDAMRQNLLLPRRPAVIHALLNRYMDPSSRDDLDALLEHYDGHAVEFSCFSINVGVFPHRNTLFWEVRNY